MNFKFKSVIRRHNKKCVKINIFVTFLQHTTKPGFIREASTMVTKTGYQWGVQQCSVMLVKSKFHPSETQEQKEFVFKQIWKKLVTG